MNQRNIEIVHGKGQRKHPLQRFLDEFTEDAEKILKYSVYYKIADGRNSFSKTDYSATFMHMKYDYYNHTNVFKPRYNVQMGSSNRYIRHVYVSSDGNDINTYIPFMEGYHTAYGSFDNYSFCKENKIELYMKYNTYRKEQEKLSDKNQFKYYMMKPDESGNITCPAGHVFTFEDEFTDFLSIGVLKMAPVSVRCISRKEMLVTVVIQKKSISKLKRIMNMRIITI